jgi:hypothetical protein
VVSIPFYFLFDLVHENKKRIIVNTMTPEL